MASIKQFVLETIKNYDDCNCRYNFYNIRDCIDRNIPRLEKEIIIFSFVYSKDLELELYKWNIIAFFIKNLNYYLN